jgi:hypothetical protein
MENRGFGRHGETPAGADREAYHADAAHNSRFRISVIDASKTPETSFW